MREVALWMALEAVRRLPRMGLTTLVHTCLAIADEFYLWLREGTEPMPCPQALRSLEKRVSRGERREQA